MRSEVAPGGSGATCARTGRPLRIAQLAPLYERVPPALYGGTERVVSYLCEGLVERGHDVTLFASGDSITHARLEAATARALRLDGSDDDPLYSHVLEISRAFDRAAEFDVIHCHVDALAFPFGRLVATPTIHTMHGRLDLPAMRFVYRHFRDVPLVSISDSQRRPLADLDMTWVATVNHGLPIEAFEFSPGGGEYLAFLGRMGPEKRPDLAIEVATRAGIPLKMAAKVDPVDRAYFESQIRPRLDHPLVEYVGEVGEEDRAALLRGARALLFPIDWPEPFGLVMIEALAFGTPVVARPAGSVPEIVEDGRTGLIADTVDDLVDAVKRVDRIDRATCRREAERRFSIDRMLDGYEAVYARILQAAERA
jgi:glycosyltransferase involved in cell wall biosynthesis